MKKLVLTVLVLIGTAASAATLTQQLADAQARNAALQATNSALNTAQKKAQSDTKAVMSAFTSFDTELAALVAKEAALKAKLLTLQSDVIPPPAPPVVTPPTTTTPPDGSGTPPPSTSTSDVVLDHLGQSYAYYHPTPEQFPDQYLRPVVPMPDLTYRQSTSEGLGVYSSTSGDFSSTEGQVGFLPDLPLVVTTNSGTTTLNTGIGVDRVRFLEMSNNTFAAAPLWPWNVPNAEPDPHSTGWIQFSRYASAPTTIGHPIGIARGYGGWSNCGLVLFSGGYVGTAGTATAFAPWSGEELPTDFKPTGIAVTSKNEFALVCGTNTTTGKGQVCVISLWGGGRLQAKAVGYSFPQDWPEPYPSAPNPGVWAGMKILGFVDLPINAPTGISAIGERTTNRLNNKTDGNAGYLQEYNLSSQADRDSFNLGHPGQSVADNPNFVSRWGFAVVISKTENKAVYVDLRALFSGIFNQYFTTQALFDATVPKQPDANWWQMFGMGDTDWPYTFTGKPEWRPSVAFTVDVQAPTAVLISEHGQGQVAVASEDGTIRFWKGGPAYAGTDPMATPQADGSVKVGPNVTCLAYDKYPDIRSGGLIAVSRGDRSISFISDWGSAGAITKTLRDARLLDPVAAECADTHGLTVGILTVCDFTGKQVLNYRYTDLNLVNYGNQVFPIQGGAQFECTGTLALPGKPIAVSGANVN